MGWGEPVIWEHPGSGKKQTLGVLPYRAATGEKKDKLIDKTKKKTLAVSCHTEQQLGEKDKLINKTNKQTKKQLPNENETIKNILN